MEIDPEPFRSEVQRNENWENTRKIAEKIVILFNFLYKCY